MDRAFSLMAYLLTSKSLVLSTVGGRVIPIIQRQTGAAKLISSSDSLK